MVRKSILKWPRLLQQQLPQVKHQTRSGVLRSGLPGLWWQRAVLDTHILEVDDVGVLGLLHPHHTHLAGLVWLGWLAWLTAATLPILPCSHITVLLQCCTLYITGAPLCAGRAAARDWSAVTGQSPRAPSSTNLSCVLLLRTPAAMLPTLLPRHNEVPWLPQHRQHSAVACHGLHSSSHFHLEMSKIMLQDQVRTYWLLWNNIGLAEDWPQYYLLLQLLMWYCNVAKNYKYPVKT